MIQNYIVNNTNSLSLTCEPNPNVDGFALDGDLFCNRKNENFFIKNAILFGVRADCVWHYDTPRQFTSNEKNSSLCLK